MWYSIWLFTLSLSYICMVNDPSFCFICSLIPSPIFSKSFHFVIVLGHLAEKPARKSRKTVFLYGSPLLLAYIEWICSCSLVWRFVMLQLHTLAKNKKQQRQIQILSTSRPNHPIDYLFWIYCNEWLVVTLCCGVFLIYVYISSY